MTQFRSAMRTPDPFVMDEDTVNVAVANYFRSRGFRDIVYLSGKQHGVDVSATSSDLVLLVESKGSHANHHNLDTVFGRGQLWDHLGKQVLQLMSYKESFPLALLLMANPAIPRIESLVNGVKGSLDWLGFIRLWVAQDLSVSLDIPIHLRSLCTKYHLV